MTSAEPAGGLEPPAKRLIVVGPLPPPHHGVTVSTSLILDSDELKRRFRVEHLDTSDHRSRHNIGRWELGNVAAALSALARLAARLRGETGVVYLPLSQGLAGLTRDTLLIRLAAARGWRVAGHLRGGEIDLILRRQRPPVRRWLERGLGRLDSVAVLGRSIAGVFDGVLPRDRVAIIPNGTPDPGIPAADGVEGANGVVVGLFLSNLRRRKGAVEAMTAAVDVARGRPQVRFVFAGDSEDAHLRAELLDLARDAGERIEVTDPVTGEDKRALLERADFLLFPPVEPEGHPRVVLEAMAAGLPVITTDRGAIAETVVDGESGFVLADPVPEQLAKRMRVLIDDPQRRASMSRSARLRFERHFAQDVADRRLADWLARVAGAAE